jgi:predicted RNA binding protein YcfA (HicA-like mRNA interferase family)
MIARLPSCTAHDVDRVLTRQGFIVTHQKGSHRYYESPITGKIVTTVPMHPGDLSRSLLKKILKQVGLSEEEFRRLL